MSVHDLSRAIQSISFGDTNEQHTSKACCTSSRRLAASNQSFNNAFAVPCSWFNSRVALSKSFSFK